MTGEPRERKKKKVEFTHLPVIARRHPSDLPQMLRLHPLMLGDLADAAGFALHGEATTDGFGVFVQAIQRTVHTARGGDGRGLLRTFGGPQGGGDIERALERTQLARLERQLVEGGLGEPRRGGRVIQGSVGGGIRGRGVAVDGDLVDWSVARCGRAAGGGGGGRHNVSRHFEGCRV